jgi:hypothetical protein
LELCAGDVGNAYLEAFMQEEVCLIFGKEFEDYGHSGHLLMIVKAVYGLKTSGARWHEKLANTLLQLQNGGSSPSYRK